MGELIHQLFDLVDEVAVQHRRRVKTSVLNEVGWARAFVSTVGFRLTHQHTPAGCSLVVATICKEMMCFCSGLLSAVAAQSIRRKGI